MLLCMTSLQGGIVPILKKNCNPFPLFLFNNTFSEMNIFVYSIYPFLLQSPFFSSTLLPNHMLSLKSKLKHMAVDITCFFSISCFQFSYAMRHNDVNSMTLHYLLYTSFPGFQKTQSFSKNCFKCPS